MKKILAVAIAPIAAIGLSISLTGLASASATDPSGTDSTGSTVGTIPQCAWHLTGVGATVAMTHGSAAKYDGEDYALSGSGNTVNSFVAPVDATEKPSNPAADQCSWYTSKASASITVSSADNPAFTSSTFEGDTTMNFSLNNSTHKLTATVEPTCSGSWATPAEGANDIYTGHLSGEVTSLTKANTTTVSACSYQISFAATVPGGKSPAHAGSNYVMVGPTLTTTLVTSQS